MEYFGTGQVQAVERLRARIPTGVLELTRIPTLGPKKAMQLYEHLGVTSIEELRDSIQAGKLEGHRGFGAKTAENILRYGIGTAQRGWLTADDVINAWPLAQLAEFIEAKRRHRR